MRTICHWDFGYAMSNNLPASYKVIEYQICDLVDTEINWDRPSEQCPSCKYVFRLFCSNEKMVSSGGRLELDKLWGGKIISGPNERCSECDEIVWGSIISILKFKTVLRSYIHPCLPIVIK